jgi:hypothetical protein
MVERLAHQHANLNASVIGPWRHGGSNGDGSTLGPLQFVDNIFFAGPNDYRKATQRVYCGGANQSRIDLPITPPDAAAAAPIHSAQ